MDSPRQMDSSDHEDLFASPTTAAPDHSLPKTPGSPKTPTHQNARFDAEEAREAALRRELEGVRNINQVIEGVLGTLEKAKGNMNTVSTTVHNASSLLNTWTRILSQTEHNQRLILNPNWKGATQDLLEIENEAQQRQQAAARRAAEEERRREEARRKAEEDERRRQAAAATASSSSTTRGARGARGGVGARGRGRGISRGGGSGSLYASHAGSSSVGSSRGTSGIGRGFGSARGTAGRSRGVR